MDRVFLMMCLRLIQSVLEKITFIEENVSKNLRGSKVLHTFASTNIKSNKQIKQIMKVFVVSTHYESGDNSSTTTINGVRSSLESAQKLMEECFEYEKKENFSDDLEFDECEIEVSDMFCSIYNTCDSYHYVSVNIAECELED